MSSKCSESSKNLEEVFLRYCSDKINVLLSIIRQNPILSYNISLASTATKNIQT